MLIQFSHSTISLHTILPIQFRPFKINFLTFTNWLFCHYKLFLLYFTDSFWALDLLPSNLSNIQTQLDSDARPRKNCKDLPLFFHDFRNLKKQKIYIVLFDYSNPMNGTTTSCTKFHRRNCTWSVKIAFARYAHFSTFFVINGIVFFQQGSSSYSFWPKFEFLHHVSLEIFGGSKNWTFYWESQVIQSIVFPVNSWVFFG